MRYLKLVAWLGLGLAVAWVIYKPGFDSGTALVAAILALSGLHLAGKKHVEKVDSSQTQSVSGNGIGIQAGRDVTIGELSGPKSD
jgi:hypothetical protein